MDQEIGITIDSIRNNASQKTRNDIFKMSLQGKNETNSLCQSRSLDQQKHPSQMKMKQGYSHPNKS